MMIGKMRGRKIKLLKDPEYKYCIVCGQRLTLEWEAVESDPKTGDAIKVRIHKVCKYHSDHFYVSAVMDLEDAERIVDEYNAAE